MYPIVNTNKKTTPTEWRQQKYPFKQMEVGEFFLVPKKDVPRHIVASSASKSGKKFKMRFMTESYGDYTKVTRIPFKRKV